MKYKLITYIYYPFYILWFYIRKLFAILMLGVVLLIGWLYQNIIK